MVKWVRYYNLERRMYSQILELFFLLVYGNIMFSRNLLYSIISAIFSLDVLHFLVVHTVYALRECCYPRKIYLEILV